MTGWRISCWNWAWVPIVLLLAIAAISGCTSQKAEEPEHKEPMQQVTGKLESAEIAMPAPLASEKPQEASQVKRETIEDTYAEEAEYIAKTVYGEAGICSRTEQAAVIWCILNREDSEDPYYQDDIIAVITQPEQFHGYKETHPVKPELYELALDVIDRWQREKDGEADTGRVLPKDYLFFTGDGTHNYFRTDWRGGDRWDWSLPSPYEE